MPEKEGEESEPPATSLSALEGIDPVRKYLLMVSVDNNKMVAISNIENRMDRSLQKVKKQ
jgi:hypothetical protein